MGYFADAIASNGENVYVRWYLDDDKPADVELHYMLSPDFQSGPYVPEISSYKDLQQYSMKSSAVIGREKPVYHLKEIVPTVMKAAYDPHLRNHVDSYFYKFPSWPKPSGAPDPGSMIIGHPGGYESFQYYGNSDDSLTVRILGETTKRVRSGDSYTYILCNVERCMTAIGVPVTYIKMKGYDTGQVFGLSAECYGYCRALLDSFKSVDDAKAHPGWGRYVYDMGSRPSWAYVGSWVNEQNLFDPRRDYELVADYHTKPIGLDAKLVSEALAKTSFNSNSIANLLDVFDLANNIRKGDLASIFLDFKKGGKVAADAWLKYRYVYSTTKSDLQELYRYASIGEPTVCRAGESVSGGKMHVKIKLVPKTNQLGQIVDRLTREGLAPNAYNLWDLVPFSFVVDWFVGIGDFLEGITQYGRVAAFDIMSVTTSWTWKDHVTKGNTTATYVFYERTVSPSAPAYVPYVETRSASGETILKRCADTVALIGG